MQNKTDADSKIHVVQIFRLWSHMTWDKRSPFIRMCTMTGFEVRLTCSVEPAYAEDSYKTLKDETKQSRQQAPDVQATVMQGLNGGGYFHLPLFREQQGVFSNSRTARTSKC